MTRRAPVSADGLGISRRDAILAPDEAERAHLADRLGVPGIISLECRLAFARNRQDQPVATGILDAVVLREDVTTLEPFEATVHERFQLRFLPEGELPDTLDPNDPVDDVGYAGTTVDLEEVLAEQLALALDPYPRAAG